MNNAYDTIREAILHQRQILAEYQGYVRELCPHTLGIKNGREQGLFYQFGGDSSSGLGLAGSSENWRCMRIDELDDVQARDGEWHTSQEPSTRRQTCVDEVDVEVGY